MLDAEDLTGLIRFLVSDDSKYINLLVDYNELVKRKTRIQRFVSHPEQKLSFLKNSITSFTL